MIEFNDVSKVYPNGTKALDGINLKIDDGELVFIIGASGAGKSTLMKLLLREEKVSSGTLTVDDINLNKLSDGKIPYYRRKIGYVFQDFRLFKNKTVYENVAFAMQVIGESKEVIRGRVPAILRIVGLEEKYNRFPDELSGGEQQRVALARALANNPSTIIADEPTGNLDPAMSKDIMGLLARIQKRGKTVIVVTHERTLVKALKKRVVIIEHGKIIGDYKEVKEEEEANAQV